MDISDLLVNIKALLEKNDYKAINELLTEELLRENKNPELYTYKASACNQTEKFESAHKYAQEAIKLAHSSLDAYLQRGIAFYYGGHFSNAINDFDYVLNYDNQNKVALFLRAQSCFSIYDYKRAIEDYSNALKIFGDIDKPGIYYNRGLANNALGNNEAAIRDFDNVIALDVDYYQAYCDRGVANFMLEKYDQALEDLKKCLAKDGAYATAYYNKGLVYHKKNEYEVALENYTKAIEYYKPTMPVFVIAGAYNNRGNIFMNAGEYDKAVEDFDKAINITPSLGTVFLNRGIIHQQRLLNEKAKADFSNAKQLLQFDKENNKVYLDFLEEQIKLLDEKAVEADKLARIDANEPDKKKKLEIEIRLDNLIGDISKAARAKSNAVVHYTKLFVADIYVKASTAKINYSNAIYMNDPAEGKILLNYLKNPAIKKAFENGEKLSELSVYIGSFLPADDGKNELDHHDELVMWRTYGKDEAGNEACGCSIVIDSKFFKPPVSLGTPLPGETADMLCEVIYIKDRQKNMELLVDKKSGIASAIAEFKKELIKLIELKKQYAPKHDFSIMIDKSVFKKLSKIVYLFKSADYKYEHEVRVLKYVARNSDTIKCYPVEKGKPGRLYIESMNPVFPSITKIYLGPKVKDSSYWSLYLDYQVKQRQNEYVLNKMSLPATVDIIKSKNEFV